MMMITANPRKSAGHRGRSSLLYRKVVWKVSSLLSSHAQSQLAKASIINIRVVT